VVLGFAMVSVLTKGPTVVVAGGEAGRIELPKDASNSLTVQFRAADAGANAVYSWDFGDQNRSTGREVVHRFAKPGSYTATLSVSDGTPALRSATVTVPVNDALFELIGVLLLAAVVGAVVLAKRNLDSPEPPAAPAEGHH